MATERRNRQRAKKRRAAQQGPPVDTDAAPWPFQCLFAGGNGGLASRHERADLALARQAINADWPIDPQAKRVALVSHFIAVMRHYGNILERPGSDCRTLGAAKCLIACDLANLRSQKG